ncbi:hypothetical protein O9993_12255 [Vibrio lentus]|nr:hypothetical protein [Vibrio lentus]
MPRSGLKITVVYFLVTFTAAVLGGYLISKSPWKNEIKRADELEDNKGKGLSSNASTCIGAPSSSSRIRNAMGGAVCSNESSHTYCWVRRSADSLHGLPACRSG